MSKDVQTDPLKLMSIIAGLELFKNLQPSDREVIQKKVGDIKRFSEGEIIVKEGAHDPEFYIVLEGTADVFRGGKLVNKMKKGGFIGEVAYICHEPRSATVTATSQVKLLPLNVMDMRRFSPEIREPIKDKIIEGLVKRINGLNKATINLENIIKQLKNDKKE